MSSPIIGSPTREGYRADAPRFAIAAFISSIDTVRLGLPNMPLRLRGGNDLEPVGLDFDELHTVAGIESERVTDLDRNRDLPLAGEGGGCHGGYHNSERRKIVLSGGSSESGAGVHGNAERRPRQGRWDRKSGMRQPRYRRI